MTLVKLTREKRRKEELGDEMTLEKGKEKDRDRKEI